MASTKRDSSPQQPEDGPASLAKDGPTTVQTPSSEGRAVSGCPLLQLPLELLDIVLDYLTPDLGFPPPSFGGKSFTSECEREPWSLADLARLSRTCKALRRKGMSRLWRHVTFDLEGQSEVDVPADVEPFVESVWIYSDIDEREDVWDEHDRYPPLVDLPDAHVATLGRGTGFQWTSKGGRGLIKDCLSHICITIAPDKKPFSWTALPRCYLQTGNSEAPTACVKLPTADEPAPILSQECINYFMWELDIDADQATGSLPSIAWLRALGRPQHGIAVRWRSADERRLEEIVNDLALSLETTFPLDRGSDATTYWCLELTLTGRKQLKERRWLPTDPRLAKLVAACEALEVARDNTGEGTIGLSVYVGDRKVVSLGADIDSDEEDSDFSGVSDAGEQDSEVGEEQDAD